MEEMLNEKNESVVVSTNTSDDPSLEEFTPNIENESLEENEPSEIIIQDVKKELIHSSIKDETGLEEYGKKIEETNVHVNIEEKELPSQNHDIKIDIDHFVFPDTDTENDELKEMNDINFNIDTLEPMKLKKPNEFYYEIYKKAKEKAKQAKKEMLIAYLEAKNIKKTYMLDDLEDDSDSDISLESELDLENDENEYFNNEN
jgi:hypothetical protein